MKTTHNILIIILTLLLLVGCINQEANINNYKSEKYVKLADYKSMTIDKNYLELSESDIDTIIYLDMSTNNYYKSENRNVIQSGDIVSICMQSENVLYNCENFYYEIGNGDYSDEFDDYLVGKDCRETYITIIDNTSVTISLNGIFTVPCKDDNCIKMFYKTDSVAEAKEIITEKVKKERIFNSAFDTIMEESKIISVPDCIYEEIEHSGYDSAEITEAERQSIQNFFNEFMILKAILDSEKVEIKTDDINAMKKEIAKKTNISVNELEKYYSDIDIMYQTLVVKAKEIIVPYIAIIG